MKEPAIREAVLQCLRNNDLSTQIREKINNPKQIDFLLDLAAGRIEGSTIKERQGAIELLWDRAYGRSPETVVNVDVTERPLASVSAEELLAAIRGPSSR